MPAPTAPTAVREDLEAWDEPLFSLPVIDWPISVNKIHALTYGLLLGPFVGVFGWQSPILASGVALLSLATAFGLIAPRWEHIFGVADRCPGGHRSTIAILTIRHKPHYFGFAFVVGVAIPAVLHGV